MSTIDNILNKDEKIIWRGKPKFVPFVFSTLAFTFIGLFMLFVFTLLISIFSVSIGIGIWPPSNNSVPPADVYPVASALSQIDIITGFVTFAPIIYLILLLFTFGPLIYASLLVRITEYAITDKRMIIQTGIIGRDFESIDYERIQDLSVNVGLFEKLTNTGTIIVGTSSGIGSQQGKVTGRYSRIRAGLRFRAIPNPYKVFKDLKKIALDIKADIHFPTAFRPETNVGYKTKYKPK